MYKVIDQQLLDQLSEDARQRDRLRVNLNFHKQLTDPVQRLCNALEPNTYVQPHRHRESDKWEFFCLLRGRLAVVIFDEQGRLNQRIELNLEQNRDQPRYAIEIAPNQWHTLISLQSGTVALEIKPGPYQATSDKDFATWAPKEGEPNTAKFLYWFENGKIGSLAPAK